MQNHGLRACFFQDSGGHEDAAGGRARGEHLARGDLVAAFDALALPAPATNSEPPLVDRNIFSAAIRFSRGSRPRLSGGSSARMEP